MKTLVIKVEYNGENASDCWAYASGDPSFDGRPREHGSTPREAIGSILSELSESGLLNDPVRIEIVYPPTY